MLKRDKTMQILKPLFWVSAVVLLLPAGNETAGDAPALASARSELSASQVLNAAFSTADDLSGFCGRQPSVCETGQRLISLLERKAKYGVRLIYDWANSGGLPGAAPVQGGERMAANEPAAPRGETAEPQPLHTGSIATPPPQPVNSLKVEDLIPAWRRPAPQRRG
jgi:hypothetical protein